METKLFDLSLRAIIYQEDGIFLARCLEMDLIGTGETEKESLRQLQEIIEQHISFALFKDDDGLILFPSEKIYFDRWEQAYREKFRHYIFPDRAIQMNGKAVFIRFTQDDLVKLKRASRFSAITEHALA